jgi:hypothetical protein
VERVSKPSAEKQLEDAFSQQEWCNMSYAGISVHEAMEKLNTLNNGWYLPYIQRQYVWGDRDKSEEYVCLLLDSLKKGYPIGGLVIWETTRPVCREFLNEYEPRKFSKQIDRPGHKFLVYDGQQRLQTLRSVLYYAFNGRVLHFNFCSTNNKNTRTKPDSCSATRASHLIRNI